MTRDPVRAQKGKPFGILIALFAVFSLFAAACGGSDGTATDGANETTEGATETTDGATETTAEAGSETTAEATGEPLKIAVIAPSASNDLAFTQSMVDAVNKIGETRDIQFDITDNTFVIEDAAAAIRGYAEDGFDLVIAHGSQYGGPLAEIAPDFPETSFAWGTAADTFGEPNVYAYAVRSDEGGYVMGTIAAQISGGTIGVVGPVEVGDAQLYVDGFVAGVAAQDSAVKVNVNYIESFSDVALASEAAKAHISNGADVLTGSAQMVSGATGVARADGVPWFGTQANQSALGSDIVVASQVYHWEVILADMIAGVDAGTLGGEVFTLTLANDGLVIEYNDGYPLDAAIRSAADATTAGIADGSISTGVS